MTYETPEYGELARELTWLEQKFTNFHNLRAILGLWNLLVSRNLPEAIAADLAVNAEGIDFQSPDPAKAIQDHIAILMLNEPQFDAYVPGESQKSRDLERDQLLVKSTWFRTTINPQRRWERRVAEGQVRHGIKVEWLRANACKPDYDKGNLNPRMGCPNYMENTLLDGNYWLGEDDDGSADAHYYRYAVPIVDNGIVNQDGKHLTLDSLGEIGWLDHDQTSRLGGTQSTSEQFLGKEVDIIVRDARDLSGEVCPLEGCDHVRRLITVYVCPSGRDFKQYGQEVETYPSPFQGSSFFIIGGHTNLTERDPDRVYRPLMEQMYYLQSVLNMLVKSLMVLSLQESSDAQMYANASQAKPENVNALLLKEGGMEDAVKLPDPGSNEVPVYPFTIERMPKKTSAEIMQLIKLVLEMMAEAKPNRFQTGVNYTELSNGTASANLAALQQSGLTYEPLLMMTAVNIDKWHRYTDHQIRWNALVEPDEAKTRYYATVMGDKNVMRYGSTAKRGEEVYLDADKCANYCDLIVEIENLTWAERQTQWYLVYSQYQAGAKTVQQLIKAAGARDVIAQMRDLYRDQVRQSLQPLAIRMADLKMTKEASINSGFDFGALLQQTVPQQGAVAPPTSNDAGANNTQPANQARSTVTLPALGQPPGGAG